MTINTTEHTRAEQARRESEERYRTLFESIDEGVCIIEMLFDENGKPFDYRFLETNPTFVKQTGLEQAAGRTAREIVPNLEGHWFEIYGKVALTGEPVRFVDGSEAMNRWFAVYAVRVGGPESRQIAIFFTDITERKKAERALRESEQRLRLASSAAKLGVFEWSAVEDRPFWENDRMYEIFGRARKDGAINKAEFYESYLHPDDVAMFERALLDSMKPGNSFHVMYRIRRQSDDQLRWLECAGNFELDSDGTPLRLISVIADVTERKQAEETLHFLAALSQATQPLTDADEIMSLTARLLGEYLGASRCAYAEVEADEDHFRITGDYTQGTFSIVGRFSMSSFGNEALRLMQENKPYVVDDVGTDARTRANLASYRQTEIAAVVSVPLHKDGRFVAGMAVHQKTPRRWTPDEVELVHLVVNLCWESLERARAARELRESAERYRTLAETASDAIITIDEESTIIYANPGAEKIFGHAVRELAGQPLTMLMPHYFRRSHSAGIAHYLETGRKHIAWDGYQLPGLHKSGREIPLEVSFGEFVRDGRRFFTGIVRDVSERVRAEEALRASESELRALFAAMTDVVLVLGADGRYLKIAPTNPKLLYKPPDELIGRTLAEVLPPERAEFFLRHVRRALEEREPHKVEYSLEIEGAEVWFEASISPMSETAVFWIARDITERKRAEEERERLLMREQEARREAEEASRLKDEFLATVSHELRTPLTAIIGWSSLLRSGRLDDITSANALETIVRNGKAQSQLIEDLMDVSRVITGKLRLDVHPVKLISVIETAVDAVRLAADAKGIRLQTLLDPSAGPISGDSARLQQMIWNLLSNAIKFTPKGGRVQLRLERVNSHIEIVVSDTGQGISPEFLPYVFDRFRQADAATTRRHGGLGLGLAIVRHLVELHGGTVHVDSPGEGQGATFTVSLPLMIVHRAPGKEERRHPKVESAGDMECPPELDGLCVLVVDDELDARELLSVVLTQCGAKVTTAASVPDALAALEESRPDVIVSDIGMPEEDGYSFIRKVRALHDTRGGRIPAAALTAYAGAEDRKRALLAGFQLHIPKPVDPTELIAVVATLAGRTGRS